MPKTNGTAMYTIDVKLPDMLTCLIARPSRFGAKAKAFDPAPALAVAGVKEVFVVPEGVAVLADGFWAAKKGRDALKITWDESGTEARSSDAIVKDTYSSPTRRARSRATTATPRRRLPARRR